VETAATAAESLVEKAKAVSDAVNHLTRIKTLAKHLSAVTTSLKPLKTAQEAAERLYDQDVALQVCRSRLARLRDLRTKTASFGPALKALTAAGIIDSGYPVIQGTKDRLKILRECRAKFSQIEQLNQEIERTATSIETTQKQVPTCPTCGRPTNE
jgi:DNA repair exonuclease SbcCD ATPase subunit